MKFVKELVPYIIILIVVILIRLFIISPVRVDGVSMYPTLNDKDYLLIEKFNKNYKRFDIVVLNYNNEKLIKRIIGLPGDKVEYKNNKLYINDEYVEEIFLDKEYASEQKKKSSTGNFTNDFSIELLGYKNIPQGYYFVMGDNRLNSTDSRMIGLVAKGKIDGKAIFNVFKFKTVK